MPEAILALGSNLGDRRQWLIKALAAIKLLDGVDLIDISVPVESTALTPTGLDSNKPRYLNCVAKVQSKLAPEELLSLLQGIEIKLGRQRTERWGNRIIDLDIITYGSLLVNSADLIIPHPEAAKRAFVMVPWFLMDRGAVLPGVGPIRALAKSMLGEVKLT